MFTEEECLTQLLRSCYGNTEAANTVFSAEGVGKECYCTSGRLRTTRAVKCDLILKYIFIYIYFKVFKEILWLG